MVEYALEKLKSSLKRAIIDALDEEFRGISPSVELGFDPRFGDLGSPIAFQIAKVKAKSKKEQRKLANKIAMEIADRLSKIEIPMVSRVEAINGFLNFWLDFQTFSKEVMTEIIQLGDNYGYKETGKGQKVVVEHTSANPIHPLHIGAARNAVLGDTIARIYQKLGYSVSRVFYVNDMGKQVAYLVYTYRKLKDKLVPHGKIDHWFGILYSATVSGAEAISRSMKLYSARADLINQSELIKSEKEHILKIINNYIAADWVNLIQSRVKGSNQKIREVKEWLDVLSEIMLKWPDIAIEVLKVIKPDIEETVLKLVKRYEEKDENVIRDFREVASKVLDGFLETLSRMGITFDNFDWESDLIFSGLVQEIIDKLRAWIDVEEGALYVRIRRAVIENEDVRRIFGLSEEDVKRILSENKLTDLPPDLVLRRSDGTTLYTTRDIAYSVYKFRKYGANKVLNVIGKDQSLAQKQVRAALYLAGYKEYSENLIHVAYELVLLKGRKLSSRRGRYITFDEIIEEAKLMALKELMRRYPSEKADVLDERAEKIAVGAIRYALLSIVPERTLEFSWEKVLDFERNSGPFLQYTYVRALSILKKAGVININPKKIDFSVLTLDIERNIIKKMSAFPEVIETVARELKPNILVDYINKLAIMFNSFYQRYPVIRAETDELRLARLALVKSVKIVLGNALDLLGIPRIERM